MINQTSVAQRLKDVLRNDKKLKTDGLIGVLKSDLFDLLENYFILEDCEIDVKIEQKEDQVTFSCVALCEKIKPLNYIK